MASWRATRNVLAALLVALAIGVLLGGIGLIWGAAIVSLVDWPVGGWAHAALYIAVVVAGPVLALPAVQGLTALQRSRFRATLGVEIPAGARAPDRKPWPVGPWLAAATWRQLGFHLLSILTGTAGGGLVAACWLAPAAAVAYLAAADAERRRIERDLHDGAQQRLVSLAMNLGMARSRFTSAPEPVRQAIADAHDEAVLALSELREFIRGLYPAVLSHRGLNAALSGLAARAPLPVRLRVDVPRGASPSVEAVAYFIVSEALTNMAKHARATRAEVTVTRRDNPLDRLTPRELQVLRLMAEGHSNNGIVAVLKVSPSAVEKYVTNIFAKLDLPPTGTSHRRVLAVLKYLGT